jgi:nicotinamidase/pyrazinamidase
MSTSVSAVAIRVTPTAHRNLLRKEHALVQSELLEAGDALLVVDVQNDFCPGGALPVPEGDLVVPVLNRWIDAAVEAGVPVYASRDWHPPTHQSFNDHGGPWPPHCVQGTEGAAFRSDLRLPPDAIVVSKGQEPDDVRYSVFDETDLETSLQGAGVRRLWVGGLARDYCVSASVLDGLERGFDVRVIVPGTRGIAQPASGPDPALEEVERAGAVLDERATL